MYGEFRMMLKQLLPV